MKKFIVSALTCAIVLACSLSVQAACPTHGTRNLTTSCAGYPRMCEIRPCVVGSHPSNCQTERYNNYGLEECTALLPTVNENDPPKTCAHRTYTDLHLCYVIHPLASGSDYYTDGYCPY